MVWWLEGVNYRHFGWVRNPLDSYFWSQEKNRFLSEKSVIFLRFFLPKIVSNPAEKSAEKTDFYFLDYIYKFFVLHFILKNNSNIVINKKTKIVFLVFHIQISIY